MVQKKVAETVPPRSRRKPSHLHVVSPSDAPAPESVAELPQYSMETLLREKKKRDEFAARGAKQSLADAQAKMAKANAALRMAQAKWKPIHARGCEGKGCWCAKLVAEETRKEPPKR